jgi:hypothetical protein
MSSGDPIVDVPVGEFVGSAFEDSTKIDAGSNCNARQSARVSAIVDDENDTKIGPDAVDDELLDEWREGNGEQYGDDDPKVFVGYCGNPAGTGTDHPGEGRCKHHGGSSLSGRENPRFKHGLFSDVLNDEDRAIMAELEGVSNPDMLDELIRLNMMQLRRAVRYMTDDEEEARNFFDAFDDVVQAAAESQEGITDREIKRLADLLQGGQEAMQDKMELVRRLILAHSKITDGEKLNVDASTEISGGASLAVEWAGVDGVDDTPDE